MNRYKLIQIKKKDLETLLLISQKEIFDNKQIKQGINLGYKVIPFIRSESPISKKKLIDDTFNVYFKFNNRFKNEQIEELKNQFLSIPFEKSYPLIFKYEDYFYDLSIYHILNFIKDTQYVLSNLSKKQRTFHSRFKIDILQKRLKDLENIKTNEFLQPKSTFDIKMLNTKDKLLKIFYENYNIVFAYAHLYSSLPMQNIIKEKYLEESFQDFFEFVNIISITPKEAIKSLSILLYKTYQGFFKNDELELFVQNVLRIFFEENIIEINKNKVNEEEQDTFLIDSKIYYKNPYIHSTFNKIPIYGINKENKYFFYKGVNKKEFMKSYLFLFKQLGIKTFPLSMYKNIKKPFLNPQIHSFIKQYPEFFENKDLNLLNIQHTFFSEMKKITPDCLK